MGRLAGRRGADGPTRHAASRPVGVDGSGGAVARPVGPWPGRPRARSRPMPWLHDDPVQRRMGPCAHAAAALLELGEGGGLAEGVDRHDGVRFPSRTHSCGLVPPVPWPESYVPARVEALIAGRRRVLVRCSVGPPVQVGPSGRVRAWSRLQLALGDRLTRGRVASSPRVRPCREVGAGNTKRSSTVLANRSCPSFVQARG
jgi:hypothetical protein